MKFSLNVSLWSLLWIANGYSQTVSAPTLNSGSLAEFRGLGSISSSLGDAFAGVLDEGGYSVSTGFLAEFTPESGPVELLLVSRSSPATLAALVQTGQAIEVTNFNGRVLARFPAGMPEAALRMELDRLAPALYILRSGQGKNLVRLVFSPRRPS